MKTAETPLHRALVAFAPVTLLFGAPALAQDGSAPIQTTTTPPPAPSGPEPSALRIPAPVTDGVAARNGIGDPNSPTPIAPEAITQAEEARAVRPRANAPARATAPRATAAPIPIPAQSQAPAPTAGGASAPVAVAPSTPVSVPGPAPAATAAPTAPDPAVTTASETAIVEHRPPVWPWVLVGLVALGVLLAFLLRRRSRVDEDEEFHEEPVVHHQVEPVAVAPVAHPVATPEVPVQERPATAVQSQSQGYGRLEPQFLRPAASVVPLSGAVAEQAIEAELVTAAADDVAALTAGAAHGDRPWLEFAMRPVRAGSNADDVLIEIELTVGNSGAVAAQDVRISTFMFADGSVDRGEMERLLTQHSANSEVAPVTIAPGEGTRVDATLSLPRSRFGDDAQTFNPVVLADARYRMADGTEGRTSASFTIGGVTQEGDDLRGIDLNGGQMSDDIEARLYGDPAHD